MLPLPFAVCARPCATNAVLCTRDGQRFLPFARAPIELLPPHAFLNPTECEIECRNHRPRRLGEFRLMNAGDRRGPLGSHSFILGHTPRLTSSYCAVSRSPARSFKQLAPSTLAIAIGAKRRFTLSPGVRNTTCFLHFRSTYRPDTERGARATTAQEAPRPIRSLWQRLKATKRPRADVARARAARRQGCRGPPQAQVRRAPPLGGQLGAHARLRGDAPPPLRHSRSTFAVRPDVTSPPSAPPPL